MIKINGMSDAQAKVFNEFDFVEIVVSQATGDFIVCMGSSSDDCNVGQYHSNGFMTAGRHDDGFWDFVQCAENNNLHSQHHGEGVRI